MLLDAGGGNFAIHADAFGRRTGDYRVPSYPYLTPPDPAERRARRSPARSTAGSRTRRCAPTDSRSAARTSSPTASVGLAVTQNNALYHIPGIDGEDHNTRIDAHQTKVTSKGEWRAPTSFIDAIRFWGGATDYKHNEIGLADPTDPPATASARPSPTRSRRAASRSSSRRSICASPTLTTAIGVQAGHQELTAPSPDNPGSPISGLWDPNSNQRIAGYIFNEFKFSESTKAQIAGRIEHVEPLAARRRIVRRLRRRRGCSIGPATPRNLASRRRAPASA